MQCILLQRITLHTESQPCRIRGVLISQWTQLQLVMQLDLNASWVPDLVACTRILFGVIRIVLPEFVYVDDRAQCLGYVSPGEAAAGHGPLRQHRLQVPHKMHKRITKCCASQNFTILQGTVPHAMKLRCDNTVITSTSHKQPRR